MIESRLHEDNSQKRVVIETRLGLNLVCHFASQVLQDYCDRCYVLIGGKLPNAYTCLEAVAEVDNPYSFMAIIT
jgi:hypothetical protein